MRAHWFLPLLLLATGASASEYYAASVSVKAAGVDVFHPVFVAEVGRTVDIQVADQDAAPPQAAEPFDGDPAGPGSGGSRLLFTATPHGLEGGLYDLQIEYMELRDGTWTTVLRPGMRVRECVTATLAVEGADTDWEIALALVPRNDINALTDRPQPTGLLDCSTRTAAT